MKSFRNLSNYKKMHQGTAKNKGVLEEFNAAQTLTRARKVLFGEKKKSCTGWRKHPEWANSKGRRK